ncbi:MAG: iron-sulfur cluster assembly scaffold protein [Spirochaetota bacterium]|jgi:nitrogen fixation NifU-like protein|nr:iron-sulfur cluster assembly scaffold protein [Spirochaetota bacterium]
MAESSAWVYSDTVKEHFLHPRNILRDDEDFAADGSGTVGSVQCGDEMLVLIKVADGRIADCRWRTYGCASAIASTSALSEMAKGMTLGEAARITPKQIMAYLGGLPEAKVHCSVLGDKALRAAIDDYAARNGVTLGKEKRPPVIICDCTAASDQDIMQAARDGAVTWGELQQKTKIGTGCGKCKERAMEALDEAIFEIHHETMKIHE